VDNVVVWRLTFEKIERHEGYIIADGEFSASLPTGDSVYNKGFEKAKIKLADVPNLMGRLFIDISCDHDARKIEKCTEIGIIAREEEVSRDRVHTLNLLRYGNDDKKVVKDVVQGLNLDSPSVRMEYWPKSANSWGDARCYLLDLIPCPECGGPKIAQLPCRECGAHPIHITWVGLCITIPAGITPMRTRWRVHYDCIGYATGEMHTIQDKVTYDTARTRIRKAVVKAGRAILGGGTRKGLFVFPPSGFRNYDKVILGEDEDQ
jgi:hypothetical protein